MTRLSPRQAFQIRKLGRWAARLRTAGRVVLGRSVVITAVTRAIAGQAMKLELLNVLVRQFAQVQERRKPGRLQVRVLRGWRRLPGTPIVSRAPRFERRTVGSRLRPGSVTNCFTGEHAGASPLKFSQRLQASILCSNSVRTRAARAIWPILPGLMVTC